MDELGEALAHSAAALVGHLRQLQRDGRQVPPLVLLLAELVTNLARQRQTAPGLDRLADLLDGRRMEPLLLSRPEAAELLGVSVRTLDRLAAVGGPLVAVKVEGSTRFRRADLDAYVAGLRGRPSFRGEVTVKRA